MTLALYFLGIFLTFANYVALYEAKKEPRPELLNAIVVSFCWPVVSVVVFVAVIIMLCKDTRP